MPKQNKSTKRRENLLKILNILIRWLTKRYNKYKNLPEETFTHLAPTDIAKDVDNYLDTLDWALHRKNKIKNIAITGPFGSGKSSVLQTFQNERANADYKFLNLSLATFKYDVEGNTEDGDEEGIKDHTGKIVEDKVLRLIELSLLQQLFYHEDDKSIPDSRFKKIRRHNKYFLLGLSFFTVLVLVSATNLIFPDLWDKVFKLRKPTFSIKPIHITSIIISFTGLFLFILKLFKIVKGVAINKFSINNAEIEIDNKISKSILNNHIDEILYFFEATDYNIVIIEDLDRFEQSDVFTKLREINLLINNRRNPGKEVVFIYAIRDDVFTDKERVKFFDFIIPIIPVINSYNSNDKLLNLIKENNYEINTDLIYNVSTFIDDMRLLYNIVNEYHLYYLNLNKKLDQNKLFAILVYKNIFPKDFSNLLQSDSELNKIIERKKEFISNKNTELNKEIIKQKEEIKRINENEVHNIIELRASYLLAIINRINNGNHKFYGFYIQETQFSIQEVQESEELFDMIREDSYQFLYETNSSYRLDPNFAFEDIEAVVDSTNSYDVRKEMLDKQDLVDDIKFNIEKLEKQINKTKELKLSQLLLTSKININISTNQKQNDLLNILIRNGYIDENYFDYISIFYEGNLTKPDYQFLINVKTQVTTPPDHKLYQIKNLVERINISEFDNKYVFNYDLVNFLLENDEYTNYRNRLLDQLANETNPSVRFIDRYIDSQVDITSFLYFLCKSWSNIWNYIYSESNYTTDRKDKYLRLIIESADVQDYNPIFSHQSSTISSFPNILSITDDIEKLKKFISTLNLKISNINNQTQQVLVDYIYKGRFYEISKEMLRFFLAFYNQLDESSFSTQNYTHIKSSNLTDLIKYIEDNIEDYIKSVWLILKENSEETEKSLIELLNFDKISIELKEKIIIKSNRRFKNVNRINNSRISSLLLVHNKLHISWDTINYYYSENENIFSENVIDYLNRTEVANILGSTKVKLKAEEKDYTDRFIFDLLKLNELENDNYDKILKAIPYRYTRMSLKEINFDKKQLIITNRLLYPINQNFQECKKYEDLQIELAESQPSYFMIFLNIIDLDVYDITSLLESGKFTVFQKAKILKKVSINSILDNVPLLTNIGKLVLENKRFSDKKELIYSVLIEGELETKEKIRIFNKYKKMFNNPEITHILRSLPYPYSRIALKRKKPLLPDNKETREFLDVLLSKNYISKIKIEEDKGIRVITYNN